MKKKLIRLLTALLCIALFMAGTVGCSVLSHEHRFSFFVSISAQNVPEGTYYADLLVQLPEKDRLRVPDTGVRLAGTDITEDSEVFRYCQDDYVSASLHYGYAESFVFPEKQDPDTLCTELHLSGNTTDGRFSKGKEFLWIPSFRIAYVSQDGSVLGITEPAEAEAHSFPVDDIPFYASGSSARYDYTMLENLKSGSVVFAVEMFLLTVFAVIAIPVYAIAGIVRLIRRRIRKTAEPQQDDNQNGDNAS